MIIETFPVGLLQCNCTILGDETSHEAIVIDPGGDASRIMAKLDEHGLSLKQIICTHTHIDHVGAIFELQQRSGTPAAINRADMFLFEHLDVQAQFLNIESPKKGSIDSYLFDGQTVACSGFEVGVIHTPGHTPGSTTFVLNGDRRILFAGDTLFMNGIGRTDLWGGSQSEILSSIENRLMTFDDDTIVIAGHGRSTTIGHERRHNPFLR
jgi:glyoxylase-like metal-dependent hydrolase (beta-lactamase superfamily II)